MIPRGVSCFDGIGLMAHRAFMPIHPLALTVPLILCLPSVALAGASDWQEVEGGALRIVTEKLDPEKAQLRGALELRLKPGWKTYWMDPGDAGVPPTLTIRHDGADLPIKLRFPAPRRFADSYSAWAGYDRDVSLAFTLQLPAGFAGDPGLDAELFIGVCEQICIPVQASLPVDMTAAEGDTETGAAFSSLPGEPTGQFNAMLAEAKADRLEVEVTAGDSTSEVELFVATDGRAMLDTPEPTSRDGATLRFSIPVLSGGETIGSGSRFPYTLVTQDKAVSGVLQLSGAN